MATKHVPVQSTPTTSGNAEPRARHATNTPVARALAVLRIVTGFVFLWAFADKAFGLGYSTVSERAWVNGGSPTRGFLGNVHIGPFESMFRSWAGEPWADWLFMLGLLAVGLALVAGVGLRIAAVSGALMMLMMWAAEWPLAQHTSTGEPSGSTNPIIDYHIVYAIVLIVLAVASAGDTWGFGKRWARLPLVDNNPWLR